MKKDQREQNGQNDSLAFADTVQPSQPPLPAITPKFVLNVSPELKPYIYTVSPNSADIVEAANGLRKQLGTSQPAWINACQAMRRYQAATAGAVIAIKHETIRSPGGYLRGIISRAQKGELHLSNSLWASPGASVSKEPTMRNAWRCTPTVAAAKAGYNRRSLAETAMYRYKAVISRRLHARFCPINGLKRISDATCSIG